MNVDVQNRIRVPVPPVPISLTLRFVGLRPVDVMAVALLPIRVPGPVLMVIPLVVVLVVPVVIPSIIVVIAVIVILIGRSVASEGDSQRCRER